MSGNFMFREGDNNMMIDSEILRKKLNEKSVIDWIDKDKSPISYKQGFLRKTICSLQRIQLV